MNLKGLIKLTICVLAMILLFPQVSNAKIWTVCAVGCSTTTINAAINKAGGGDTINVAAGTYNEQVTVDKALTLNGANAGIPGYGTRGAESIVDADDPDEPTWVTAFFIESGDVTIDGFKTIDADEGIHIACDQPSWGDRENVVIKNNYIDTQEGEPQSVIAATGIIFYNDANWSGTDYSVDGAVVQDNYIYQAHVKDAIWFQDVHGSSITIKGNKVDNTVGYSGIILGATSALGFYVDLSGTFIEDNEVVSSSASGIGIQLKRFTSPTTPVSITGNTLTGGDYGIRLWAGDANTNVVAHFNNLAGNTWGIGFRSGQPWASVVDATDNWWGTINGPEHSGNTYNVGYQGSKAGDNVTYVPWWDAYPGGSSWGPVENPSASYYSSIQAAVDAASSGHTITCAAGTYNEAETFLDHAGLNFDATRGGITLSGANVGIPGYGTRGAESIIEGPNVLHGNAIYIFDGADGVVIDGFTLKAGDDIVENRADDVVIKNNIITPSASPVTTNAPGIFACECDNLTASYNWILDIGPSGGCGMFLGLAASLADITNSLIGHNLIENSGGAGILINYASGIGGNTIEYNEIKNVGHDGIRGALLASGTTIQHNEIYGSARDGVRIMGDAASHHINYNSIYGSVAYGVNNLDAATLNASGNWWGDLDPTDDLSDSVDYTPWCALDGTYNNPGFMPDLSELWVDDTSPQTGPAGYIGEGIDMVTGSTVSVMAGTYIENIVIDKALALLGAGQDSVLVYTDSSDVGPPSGPSFQGSQMVIVQADNVLIDGFTFDGDNPSLTPVGTLDARNGIISNHTLGDWDGLTVTSCTVKNIYLRGIYASAQTSVTDIHLANNTVYNANGVSMQSAGIMLWGGSGVVDNNMCTNSSLGICLQAGSDGMVESNELDSCELGIVVNGNSHETVIHRNLVSNSDQGIQTIGINAPVLILVDTLRNCDYGLVLYGLGNGTTNVQESIIDGLGAPWAVGVYASTNVSPWGVGDVRGNFRNNQIINSWIGIVLNEPATDTTKDVLVTIGGDSTFYNLIYDNDSSELELEYCNDDINATYNYWGKSLVSQIEQEIFHQVDNPSLGLVDFSLPYLLGDVTLDRVIDLADVIFLINYLYKNGPAPYISILGDTSQDEVIDISDVIVLINYLYKGGPPPTKSFKVVKVGMDEGKLSRPAPGSDPMK
ncbi:MAG: right-handed parallel beta-helix repeat-containing protein [candidate division Zixibacteria bacterium]|nr:right-handed parallel beta-helix repeat-containing protein [candidate division Zixibacteria bacterium]